MPSYQTIILGAGRSVGTEAPSALVPTNGSQSVLDWILSAFEGVDDNQFHFVGGYQFEKLCDRYPSLRFHLNVKWKETGSVASFKKVPVSAGKRAFVCYSDIVFRSGIIKEMLTHDSDIVIAYDSTWKNRYQRRTNTALESAEKIKIRAGRLSLCAKAVPVDEADGEYAGIVLLSPRALAHLQTLNIPDREGMPELLNALRDLPLKFSFVDIKGEWAELEAPQDLAKFVLGTKAESLERLRPLLRSGQIEPSVIVTWKDWQRNRRECLEQVRRFFGKRLLAVRSSAIDEDSWESSQAGVNESLLNVTASRAEDSIGAVFNSYKRVNDENQVLVQPMLEGVTCSGVLFSRSPETRSPYYVINYDDTSRRTDTVTSGNSKDLKTYVVARSEQDLKPQWVSKLIGVVKEIETLIGHDSLDIEFALTHQGVHVLQVRPIACPVRERASDGMVEAQLKQSQAWFARHQTPKPGLSGAGTLLSVMADWNPAEIIGVKPSPLAFSLYRYLITDDTWAQQRAECGYRDVRPHSLIVNVMGHPYVDVRVTFNSFVPAALPELLSEKLVDYYLGKLKENPALHDKVEFEILLTCVDFETPETLNRLLIEGFTKDEIQQIGSGISLVTQNILSRWQDDLIRIKEFENRSDKVRAQCLSGMEKTYLLLEEVRCHGALAFSHLARGAFVATGFLRSLERIGILSSLDLERYLSGIRTVSSQMQLDARKVRNGQLPLKEFVSMYGHLRPGTYDICSERYDANPEAYLKPIIDSVGHEARAEVAFEWSGEQKRAVESHLRALGLPCDVEAFDRFVRGTIEAREFAKFIFTRNLSEAIEEIAAFASSQGISREEASFLKVSEFLELREGANFEPREALSQKIQMARRSHKLTEAVSLPSLIRSKRDFTQYSLEPGRPNYVTSKCVHAEIAPIDSDTDVSSLAGKIALISSADPGFDWLFSQPIVGLVTQYGGVNSHMAVRAAEFGLPAAIGVGEVLFKSLQKSKSATLDCKTKRLEGVVVDLEEYQENVRDAAL